MKNDDDGSLMVVLGDGGYKLLGELAKGTGASVKNGRRKKKQALNEINEKLPLGGSNQRPQQWRS